LFIIPVSLVVQGSLLTDCWQSKAAFGAHIPVICIPDIKVPNQHCLEMTKAALSSVDKVIGRLTN